MDSGKNIYGRGRGRGRGVGGDYQNQRRTTRSPVQGNPNGLFAFRPPIQSYRPQLSVQGQSYGPKQEEAGPSRGRGGVWSGRPWGPTPPPPSVPPQRAQGAFIKNLKLRSRKLGMFMEDPLVCRVTGMDELTSITRLDNLLRSVKEESSRRNNAKLQIIICVMRDIHRGYNFLKWVSEVQIGVLTQCCLMVHANKGQDQYLANLCLKINAKFGGSNAELIERLPNFKDKDHVMFIGADVNHPGPGNFSCPSIVAVVGTMNWPAANRYSARVCPQEHRKEKIEKFGTICLDLVKTYARLNCVWPNKIVIFRDGVSYGQFGMVLDEELHDLEKALYDGGHCRPKITVVVAQKRHQTRLFLENELDGGATGNVPPGTVVDTTIVHPFEFDFYLCSHYGGTGTSRPTQYYVLWDDNSFTSDGIQKLIHHMCFTYARCTKPVSIVPPLYYANIVAFRGHMYQKVAKDLQPSGSFNQSFYNIHPDLQNVMFFV